ncbi:MAG TPA: phosphoribosylaminoimidazolesuccinocarboxamide synthase [Phototrophicaceae bacterium]|jgi:phosphoribosylaminoimidazole-succinocarboxamide synthase|nr:phosphoribosylaminoimidazolesuccinocarboxamide synthase [Phototrophicaceae bacterium]
MLTHEQLLTAIPQALDNVEIEGWGEKISGKVRENYARDGQWLLITTDRVSAFDRILGLIPYKGQVLNQLSLWWFEQTRSIVANHVLSAPDPNITVAREAESLPVEVVVRGYITGVTSTSMWTLYEQGDRLPYGIPLPDGLRKNDRLPNPVITPTTKATGGAHDERLTRDEIINGGLVEQKLWEQVEDVAIRLFTYGQQVAEAAGLILVDTKYEFGLIDGQLTLIDEIHTPDSSRYWIKSSYQPGGDEPENMDKEFLRKWFAAQGYRGEGTAPIMPSDFVATVAARYISTYENLTGHEFVPGELPVADRIRRNLQ